MSVPNFSDEPSPSRSRSKYRSRGNSSLLPVLLGVGLLGAVAGIVVLVLNREQKPEKKDEAKADTTVTATPNKGERKQPAPPRPQDEPKSDRPKIEKKEPAQYVGPATLITDAKVLRTTLEKCLGDEFALADLNKAGVKSTFSAANAEVTLKNDTATITQFRMCVVDAKYDFDREVLTVTAVPWLLVTQRDGKRLVNTATHYLQFNCPAKEDDARRYKELFNAGLLDINVEYKIRKFTPFQEDGATGYPDAKPVTSYLIDTEVLTASLRSR